MAAVSLGFPRSSGSRRYGVGSGFARYASLTFEWVEMRMEGGCFDYLGFGGCAEVRTCNVDIGISRAMETLRSSTAFKLVSYVRSSHGRLIGPRWESVDEKESELNVPALAEHIFAYPDDTENHDVPASTVTRQPMILQL